MRRNKILSVIVILSILICMSITAHAAPQKDNIGQNIRSLVSSVRFREEKDISKLLSVANSKITNIIMKSNNTQIHIKAKVSTVEQTIEERIYDDGTIEKVNVLNYIVEPDPIPYNTSTGRYDMTFVNRAYVTDRSADGYYWERRCDSIQTIYYKHGSLPVSVTKIELEYEGYGSPEDFYGKIQTFNYPTASTTYTLYPQDKYYMMTDNGHFAMYADARYTLSDGTTFNLFLFLNAIQKDQ